MANEVRLLACGMACPVGLRVDTALAAMYAGISRFAESEVVHDAAGDPARVAALNLLAPRVSRTERAGFFATHALAEATVPLAGAGFTAVPCFLALPEADNGAPLDMLHVHDGLRSVLRATAGAVTLELSHERQFAHGRAGAFLALRSALDALERGACSMALVGGLDSQVDPITLQSLADGERLLGRRNPDGIIPGEGAAFVLLGQSRATSSRRTGVLTTNCATASEPHPKGRDGPHVGAGVTALFAELRRRPGERVDAIFSAQTGETRHARAFAYACLRNHTLIPEPLRPVTLGALLGDLGAAAGAIALVAGLASLRPAGTARPGPTHRSVLAYGESDHGTVGGCIFERSATRGRP